MLLASISSRCLIIVSIFCSLTSKCLTKINDIKVGTKIAIQKDMKYITLNHSIIEDLQTIVKTDKRHKSRIRAQAFLLNEQGIKIPEIAKIINISQRTLYRWFDRFDNNNLHTVHEFAGRGRKPLLNVDEHAHSVKVHIKKHKF